MTNIFDIDDILHMKNNDNFEKFRCKCGSEIKNRRLNRKEHFITGKHERYKLSLFEKKYKTILPKNITTLNYNIVNIIQTKLYKYYNKLRSNLEEFTEFFNIYSCNNTYKFHMYNSFYSDIIDICSSDFNDFDKHYIHEYYSGNKKSYYKLVIEFYSLEILTTQKDDIPIKLLKLLKKNKQLNSSRSNKLF